MKEFIEKLIGRLEEIKSDNFTSAVLNEPYSMGICHTIEKSISIVNQLAEEYMRETPTVTNGWIPCSEMLPEVSGEYYTYVYYDGHYMYSIDEIDCDAIVKEWNCSSDYKIIAWKPIAPYQPKGE